MIKVLIVDDQRLVRAGLRVILDLQADIEVVGEADDGAEALRQTRQLRPDVVLMDIRMPNMDGLEATRKIIAGGAARVLVLTTFDADEYVYGALQAGASGFLLKDAPPDQLIAAVRAAASGDALIDASVTRRFIAHFVRAVRPAGNIPSQLDMLTGRELEVLRLITRGLSNAEMARTLNVEETTVKTHVSHILMKLGLRDRVQAVILAYESGFVSPTGPGDVLRKYD
jgi:DNA-binding NarL/FixJ family response regulator